MVPECIYFLIIYTSIAYEICLTFFFFYTCNGRKRKKTIIERRSEKKKELVCDESSNWKKMGKVKEFITIYHLLYFMYLSDALVDGQTDRSINVWKIKKK